MLAEAPLEDFNLMVSTVSRAPGRARREVLARLRALAETVPQVVQTVVPGIFVVKVALDPRQVVQQLRGVCERAPAAFRYTLKWLPVDRWARPELEAMKAAVTHVRVRIGASETWRMTVERRAGTLEPNQVIRSLAELVDAKVNLTRPDKVLLVQLFEDRAAFSVLGPGDVLSVVRVLAAAGTSPPDGQARSSPP